MDFEKKVRSMSGKEIIMALVDGLKNPKYKIEMGAEPDVIDGVCVAGAGLNTISEISGIVFDESNIKSWDSICKVLEPDDSDFVWRFDTAIDDLCCGFVDSYNNWAASINIALIFLPTTYVPEWNSIYKENPLVELTTENYLNNLEPFIELANFQDE